MGGVGKAQPDVSCERATSCSAETKAREGAEQGQVLSSGRPAPTHRVTLTFKTSFQAGKSPRTWGVLSLPGGPPEAAVAAAPKIQREANQSFKRAGGVRKGFVVAFF